MPSRSVGVSYSVTWPSRSIPTNHVRYAHCRVQGFWDNSGFLPAGKVLETGQNKPECHRISTPSIDWCIVFNTESTLEDIPPSGQQHPPQPGLISHHDSGMLFWYHAVWVGTWEFPGIHPEKKETRHLLFHSLLSLPLPLNPITEGFLLSLFIWRELQTSSKASGSSSPLGEIKEESYYNINSIIKKMRMWNEICIKYHSVTLGKRPW